MRQIISQTQIHFMLKQLAILAGLGMWATNISAQAFEGKVKNGKTEEPALVMVYDYPETIVESALLAKFADKQLTGTLTKESFRLYPNVVIDEVSKSKLDYYFKLEGNGKKSEPKTTLYLIMHGSGDIEGASELPSRGKAFLEKMTANVKRSSDIMEIRKQEAILVDEENALSDLQKTQKELEEQLQANKAKQETQQKIIASQKMLLDDLKAKTN